MSTVGKAITLLEAFDIERAELGLTELARLVGFDKATTRRLLLSLANHGLIEQDEMTRLYRLGPAVVRFARIRETHFPFLESAKPIIVALAEETGETAHLSEYDSNYLTSVFVEESARANRVSVSVGDRLPLNATASGLAYLAFAKRDFVDAYINRGLEAATPFTVTDAAELRDLLAAARQRGYSICEQGRSEDVCSVGAPILDGTGHPVGALAIALPLVRATPAVVEACGNAARLAAQKISARLNGRHMRAAPKTSLRTKEPAYE